MSDDDAIGSGGASWLLQPPGARDVHLHIAAGENVELSDHVRRALENLLVALQSPEVAGYADCTSFFDKCKPYTCTLDKCQPLMSSPCFIDADCRIVEFR